MLLLLHNLCVTQETSSGRRERERGAEKGNRERKTDEQRERGEKGKQRTPLTQATDKTDDNAIGRNSIHLRLHFTYDIK